MDQRVIIAWAIITFSLGVLYLSIPNGEAETRCFQYGREINCSEIMFIPPMEEPFYLYWPVNFSIEQHPEQNESDNPA